MADCTITFEAGQTHERRGVAFLEYPVSYVNAREVFDSLKPSSEKYHRTSFDFWINHPYRVFPKRFHGYNLSYHNGNYTECFTFKYIEEKERFYGFLCQPRVNYQLCVLAVYAQKKENAQDLAELDRVNRMRINSDVQVAISDPRLFTEGTGKNYD
jgi:hypothetical protein